MPHPRQRPLPSPARHRHAAAMLAVLNASEPLAACAWTDTLATRMLNVGQNALFMMTVRLPKHARNASFLTHSLKKTCLKIFFFVFIGWLQMNVYYFA